MKHISQKIEQFIGTDLKYVASGSFWLILNQGVMFILSLLLLWVFANYFSKEIYGEYRFITTLVSLLAITALPGMSISLTRSVSKNYTGTLWQSIYAKIHWGFIGSLCALSAAAYYYLQNDHRLTILLVLVALAVPFIETFALHQAYTSGLKDFRLYATSRSVQRLMVVTATVIAILTTENIILIVGTFLSTSIAADLIILLFVQKKYPPNEQTDLETVTYGKHLSLMSAMRLGAQYLDKIFLWYMSGPTQVASYVIAVAIPQEITAGSAQISKLALPKMAVRTKSELRKNLLRKTGIYALCIMPVVIVYIISAPFLFSFFFPKYVDMVPFSQLCSLMTVFAANSLMAQYFYATKNKKALYAQNIVEPSTLLLLYALLIPTLGVLGAILATLIRHVVLTCTFLWFFIHDTTDLETG